MKFELPSLREVALLASSMFILSGSIAPAASHIVFAQESSEASSVMEDTTVAEGETSEEAKKEVDPVYGEKNGLDLIELQKDKPEVAPVPVRNEPNRIATNIPTDPSTSMSFNWYTTEKMEGALVRVSKNQDMSEAVEFTAEATEVISEYAERDANGFYIYASVALDEDGAFDVDENGQPKEIYGYFTDEQITRENTKWTADGDELGYLALQEVTEYSYKATATDLEADTQYYYELGSEAGGFSKVGSFRTAGEAGTAFQFIHYTDTQNAYWNANVNNEAAYGANTLEKALEVAPEADFALHTGDFVEIAQVEDEWVDNLDMSQVSNLNLPHAYTPGNHDEYSLNYIGEKDLTAFNEHTNVPVTDEKISGGSYYSFDYNGVHFTVLNTNDNKEDAEDNPEQGAIGKAQFEWARKDIEDAKANGALWTVLIYHKPVYSASYHSLQDADVQVIREDLVKMASELEVDLALQGHDHNLTRTKSLIYTGSNFAYGEVEETEKTEIDGVEYHVDPKGVTYIIPNTSGTKTYDAIYQKGAEHVAMVRPKLDWMTEEDVNLWNSLFDVAMQPETSPKFDYKHDNYRQSEIQCFAVYTVTATEFKIELYKVEGDLHGGEERKVELIDTYGITKKAANATESADSSEAEATEDSESTEVSE